MKIPKFLLKKKPARKTLRASTARRSMGVPDEMNYEEMSEPNMKLSRALLIVLVLHVVAVAGIVAFNTIKSRQGVLPEASITASPVENAPTAAAKMDAAVAAPSAAPSAAAQPKVANEDIRKAEPVKSTSPASPASDSGKIYIVAKGDNPVKIAKKLKVSESELLAANHIDDPRKLQIGQKLIVPASKSTKPKKSAD